MLNPVSQTKRPGNPSHIQIARYFLLAVLCGVAWRCLRFGLYFEMTGDESNIIRSVMERRYAGLLAPLDYWAVSPPMFLWIEKFMDSVFRNEWGARLVPFLAGMGAVGMFRLICWLALQGTARWVAWALFCVSYVPITEGTRAKGYTIDLLAAMVMLWLALRWLTGSHEARYLVWLGIGAPVFIWLSYTSVFVIGAVGLILAARQLRMLFLNRTLNEREGWDWRSALATSAFLLLSAVSAAWLYRVNIGPALQVSREEGVHAFWNGGFPPLGNLWKVPLWLLTVHAGRGFAWPIGDNHFGSILTFVLWSVGLVIYWRRGNRWVWGLFVAPQALSLAAAFLHKYPYLANPRISMFLGPGICLFVGAGLQYLISRLRDERRRPVYCFTAVVLMLCVAGGVAREVVQRLREVKGPGIRSTLADASRRLGPNGRFVVLNFGNDTGVFNYYIRRGFEQQVCLDAKLPGQIVPGQRLALVGAACGQTETVRALLLGELEKRLGHSVRIAWSQTAHQVLQDNEDSYVVWVCE
jgi:hypothetical protein